MAAHPILRAVWGPATVVAAFLGTAAVAFVTFGFFGVVIMEPFLQAVAYPAAALLTGAGATLAASWTSTLFAPMRTRAQVPRVLLWSEAAALVGVLLFLALLAADVGPNQASRLAPLVVLVTGAAAFTAVRVQTSREGMRADALVSLGLLILLPVGLFGVIMLACAVERCGA